MPQSKNATVSLANPTEIAYQSTSMDIWESKYCLKNKQGNRVDLSMDDTFKRVAKALSDLEQPAEQKRGCCK